MMCNKDRELSVVLLCKKAANGREFKRKSVGEVLFL
jgi:hypothetical protein